MEKISILIFLSLTYCKGKVKYFIWARGMLFGQKLRALFCAPGKTCLLAYLKANLSLHLPTLKFLSPTPQIHMNVQFCYWSKEETLYLLISGSIGPKEVNQFSCHADIWNWSCCQGSVVKRVVDDLPSPLLYLVPRSFWKELPSQLCLKTKQPCFSLRFSFAFSWYCVERQSELK